MATIYTSFVTLIWDTLYIDMALNTEWAKIILCCKTWCVRQSRNSALTTFLCWSCLLEIVQNKTKESTVYKNATFCLVQYQFEPFPNIISSVICTFCINPYNFVLYPWQSAIIIFPYHLFFNFLHNPSFFNYFNIMLDHLVYNCCFSWDIIYR